MIEEFKKMDNSTRTLVIICLVSAIVFVYFGTKDSGRSYYMGSEYEAGSVFLTEKYGSIFDRSRDPEGVDFVNEQIRKLRSTNLSFVIISGFSTLVTGYLTWIQDDFKDFLITLRK